MDIQYDLVPFSDAVRETYRLLLTEQHNEIELGKLEWKFRDNPKGSGLIATASRGGEIVGINAFMASVFQIDGISRPGYQSMDTVVSPVARGLGVFSNLLGFFYDRSDGDLLYGFPNLNSSQGFFGKLGWTNFGPVPMLIRPLRAGYFLKRFIPILPDFSIPNLSKKYLAAERVTRFNENDSDTWNKFSSEIKCATRRDATFLNWRVFDHPTTKYDVLRATDGSFVVSTVANKHGGRVGYLMDAIGGDTTLPSLITTSLKTMQAAGADVALSWCLPTSPNYQSYRQAGFYPFPTILRPIVINFGARPLLGDAPIINNKSSWYISYLDSDTV